MELWGWIAEERRLLLEDFERLTPAQWDVPSGCGGWTIRQVLGHLVLAAKPPLRRYGVEVAKALGSFDKANDTLAREAAERPIPDLLAAYASLVDERRAPVGFGPAAALGDILLHSLDVRLPLGLPFERPPQRYAPALELVFDRVRGRAFGPAGRPTLCWTAEDQPWSYGTGAIVRGTMADLALAATGRPPRLDHLSGPGADLVRAWLQP